MRTLCCVLVLALLLPLACDESDEQKRAAGSAAVARGATARTKPFVASVQREPFHKSSCKWAAKIHDSNLVGYDTRKAAMAGGHRPCKICKP